MVTLIKSPVQADGQADELVFRLAWDEKNTLIIFDFLSLFESVGGNTALYTTDQNDVKKLETLIKNREKGGYVHPVDVVITLPQKVLSRDFQKVLSLANIWKRAERVGVNFVYCTDSKNVAQNANCIIQNLSTDVDGVRTYSVYGNVQKPYFLNTENEFIKIYNWD